MAKCRAIIATFTLILLCLMSLSLVIYPPVKAQYQGDITINADGSVSPSTAPIQQVGNTYTLASDQHGIVSVERNDTILDGNESFLSGALSLDDVSNVTVENFRIEGGEQFGEEPGGFVAGISLDDASNVVVANNTITGISNFVAVFEYYERVAAIIVAGGHSNIISGNNLADNFQGMEFDNTAYNLIVENAITYSATAENSQGYNDPAGIYFYESSNNTIYHNNFEISLGGQASDSYYDSVNIWDDGYPSGGNYWINYLADEIDSSGIGDKPYVIDSLDAGSANNTDRYPLMQPFSASYLVKYQQETTPPKISVLSPLNQTYGNVSVSLVFTLDKPVIWTGYSLDGEQNFTITGNSTIANVTYGLHSITVFANDTFGILGSSQIIDFTVAKPQTFPTVTVVAVSVAVVVVVVLAIVVFLLLYRRHRKVKVSQETLMQESWKT